MTDPEFAWTATVQVRAGSATVADWLERSLRPEASREVPRTRAELVRGPPDSVEVRISARDSGAMRAALNTYLGWIHLALSTARAAGPVR